MTTPFLQCVCTVCMCLLTLFVTIPMTILAGSVTVYIVHVNAMKKYHTRNLHCFMKLITLAN